MRGEAYRNLSAKLRGSVITPGSDEYEVARRVYNGMIDREHLKFGEQVPTLHSTMQLNPIDGAAGRVDRHETAFSYRDAKWSMVIVGVDPDPANAQKITAWTKDYWAALHPYSLGGAYVNFMMDEGIERVKATYRDHSTALEGLASASVPCATCAHAADLPCQRGAREARYDRLMISLRSL